MVRKRIRRMLSGGAVVFIVLFCTLDVRANFGGGYIMHTISGSTGVPGVTMTGLPGPSGQTVVTDQNGYYSATVRFDWKGVVKPVKEGWTFEPSEKTYTEVAADMGNENYTGTPMTFTISGKVGTLAGVELRGLPGNPITGPDGSYSTTVEYGWKDTVTPVKEGYTFNPSNKGYPPVQTNLINENYTPDLVKLLITGSAGVEGVVMKGLPGNPVTGKDTSFTVKVDYGWTGKVTPEMAGYVFQPSEISYSGITIDQTNQNFSANPLTYTISGSVGMSGVEMRGLPGNPFSDQNGAFTATVKHGFSATVTPVKPGYTFDPASAMFAMVNSDRTNVNFTSAVVKLTISGTTRLPGVEMNGLPGNPITGTDGSFSVTVDYGWNGLVTPMKEGYEFTPENRPYASVTTNMTNQTFSASRLTYTITGSAQVAGVSIKGLPGVPVVTSANGQFTATVDHGFSGTLTPMKEGYQFEPQSIPIQSLTGPLTGQDFMPTLLKHKIAGVIKTDKGEPVEGVSIVANNNGGSTTTGPNGEYELTADYGWSGNVTPLKEGYTFRPTYKPYGRVTSDQMNQTFAAIVETFDISGAVILSGIPIDGVVITATSNTGAVTATVTTDTQGKYSLQVPYGWSGEITPTKRGIQFNPPSQTLIDVKTDYVNGQPKAPAVPPSVTPVVPPTTSTTTTTTTVAPGVTERPTQPEVTVPGGNPPPGVMGGATGGPNQPEVTVPGPTLPDGVTQPETDVDRQLRQLREQLAALSGKAGVGGAATTGPRGDPSNPLITNSWLDDGLVTVVLPDIAQQAGVTIIPDTVVSAVDPLITANLTNTPLDQALEIVLASTGYIVKKTPYYYLVASGDIADGKWSMISDTRRVTMNNITAEAAVGMLSSAFRPYVQAEAPLPGTTGTETYGVVVTAPPAMMNRIIEDLKKIDRTPGHVLLDARIVVMEKGDLLNLGVEWQWPTASVGFYRSDAKGRGDPLLDFGGDMANAIHLGYSPDATFTNALQATLNLLAQAGEATILAKPQVVAQDGKQAEMQVTTEEYYMLSAPDQQGTGFYSRVELATIESGTKLTITPHIGDSNDVTLRIAVEVSDSIPRGPASELPVVTRRLATNTVRIKDGGTVALAGLSENRTRTDKRRAPGLSNLPLIGGLFKNSTDQQASREVAVFVTAHIMPPGYTQPPGFAQPNGATRREPVNSRYTVPSEVRDFGQPGIVDPGFNRTPVNPGFNRPPAGMDRGFGQPSGLTQPMMGDDFKSQLRDSLSNTRTR